MKKILLLAIIVLSFIPIKAQNKIGAGIILGEPTGLSIKYRFNNLNSVEFGFGESAIREQKRNYYYLDYLFSINELTNFEGRETVYSGIGIQHITKGIANDLTWGIRGILGLEYMIEAFPLDIFSEVSYVVKFASEFNPSYTVVLGSRFYFN